MIIQTQRVFDLQSYFDSTLGVAAIQTQPAGDLLTNGVDVPAAGGGVMLHASSQTPVAVRFKAAEKGAGTSETLILVPGQVIHGTPFSGLRWGLPYGWLGGGSATLLVSQSRDFNTTTLGRPEVIFHRQRIQIVAANPTIVANWPIRFPWPNAVSGANTLSQGGQPSIAVTPTRVLLRLRLSNLAAPATMRMVWRGTTDFDDSNGTVNTTDITYRDLVWPANGGTNNGFPAFDLQDEWIARIGSEDGGVAFVDLSGGTLTNAYVDVVRYGKL